MVDIDESAVTLSWSKPRNDGGKKIVGYIVEYKDPTTGRWKEANDFPCDECVYQGNIPFFHVEPFMGNFNDTFGEISQIFFALLFRSLMEFVHFSVKGLKKDKEYDFRVRA